MTPYHWRLRISRQLYVFERAGMPPANRTDALAWVQVERQVLLSPHELVNAENGNVLLFLPKKNECQLKNLTMLRWFVRRRMYTIRQQM